MNLIDDKEDQQQEQSLEAKAESEPATITPVKGSHPDFEFNLRELAGSMGDFGTLVPLAIGYIVIVGLHPAGFLVMLGLTNIFLGLVYKIPMPLQPKKVVASAAIAQKWTPSLVYGTGFSLGLAWLGLSFTKIKGESVIEKISKYTPQCVIRGILLALGISLALTGFEMLLSGLLFGLIAIILIVLLRNNKNAPAALVLVLLGIGIIAFQGQLLGVIIFNFTLPPLTAPTLQSMYQGMLLAGIAQIPLSITNAVIVVAALIKDYFPERAVSEKRIMQNMGVMNLAAPFFGGFPMCHGGGGLVAQYSFGARTGGANIMEGTIELILGLLFAGSIVALFSAFPIGIVAAMLLFVSVQLVSFVKDIKRDLREIGIMLVTAILSILTNMAVGFAVGIIVFYVLKKIKSENNFQA
ncbi:putative sulfate/molybdate transporter [Candidatus Borrarchaeum sp.]|uniref:putative sulfate/molybdate transporter n=1 Tax=Candidatus Borrarchaeum sp. TaxID=2846742 RepID=UPI00257CC9C0|nr:putative sulfate/molybdate transporter [Candidatus Borrarchaeum sp.]